MASSAAAAVRSGAVIAFPSQNAIMSYFDKHPFTLTGIQTNLYVSGLFPALATHFDGRRVDPAALKGEVTQVVHTAIETNGSAEQVKLLKLNQAVAGLVQEWDRDDAKAGGMSSQIARDFKYDVLPHTVPDHLSATIAVCHSVMNDLVDQAAFSPPVGNETCWHREQGRVTLLVDSNALHVEQ